MVTTDTVRSIVSGDESDVDSSVLVDVAAKAIAASMFKMIMDAKVREVAQGECHWPTQGPPKNAVIIAACELIDRDRQQMLAEHGGEAVADEIVLGLSLIEERLKGSRQLFDMVDDSEANKSLRHTSMHIFENLMGIYGLEEDDEEDLAATMQMINASAI